MSYTPTTWTTGDTITPSALNKIEQGIAEGGGGALIVTITSINSPMDKTYAEIYNAFKDGIPCYMQYIDSSNDPIDSQYVFHNRIEQITSVYKYDDVYRIYTTGTYSSLIGGYTVGRPLAHTFQASASTDYPTFLRSVYGSDSGLTVSTNW